MNLLDPNCGMEPALRRSILLHTDAGRAVIAAEDAQFAAGDKEPLITGEHGGHYHLSPSGKKEYEKVGGSPLLSDEEKQRLTAEHNSHKLKLEFNEARAAHHDTQARLAEGHAEALRDGANVVERQGDKQKAQWMRDQASKHERKARQHRSYERDHDAAAKEADEKVEATGRALAAHAAAEREAPADWAKITGRGGGSPPSPVNWAEVAGAASQHVMDVIRRLAARRGN